MEQQRKAYWYTVIQYCPDTIRGEKMNIGVFLHCPEEGSLYHSLLDEGNAKLRYFLQTDVNIRTFRVHRDLIDFSLKKLLSSENRLVGPNHYDRKFLFDLPTEFPTEFIFSEPTFALTRNVDILFESLQKTYLGDVFSKNLLGQEPSVDHEYIRSVKVYTRQIFSQKQWIGSKIKPNVKLQPSKDLKNVQFMIDFVFKNGIWNLIQTVPSNSTSDKLTEWFSKTRTLLETYENESNFYVVYDQNDQLNSDQTIQQMVRYLKKKDSRVNDAEIQSSFLTLCEKVEAEAKDISEYSEDLIAM